MIAGLRAPERNAQGGTAPSSALYRQQGADILLPPVCTLGVYEQGRCRTTQ